MLILQKCAPSHNYTLGHRKRTAKFTLGRIQRFSGRFRAGSGSFRRLWSADHPVFAPNVAPTAPHSSGPATPRPSQVAPNDGGPHPTNGPSQSADSFPPASGRGSVFEDRQALRDRDQDWSRNSGHREISMSHLCDTPHDPRE